MSQVRSQRHASKWVTYGAPTFRFHQWHLLPIVLFHLSLYPSLSDDCLMITWMLERCLAVLSAYSFSATGLTLPSPLSSPPLLDLCLSCLRSSADNTGGGSGGPGLPGNFLTNHIAAVTCCILAGRLAPLCVHCGETLPVCLHCGNITMCTRRFRYTKSRTVGGAWISVMMGMSACLHVYF